MSNVATIYANLKTAIQTALGSGYLAQPHMMDLEDNSFQVNPKRWSAVPGPVTEVPGVTRFWTGDIDFTISLTDSWVTKTGGDSAVVDKTIAMLDKMFALYSYLVDNKAGTPATVMLVHSLQVQEPLLMKKEHVVLVEAIVKVRTRTEV
jgi:hypothetical protein